MKLNKKKLFIILLAIAVCVIGLVWYKWFSHSYNKKIVISGNMELTEVNIAFKISGKLIELNVKEGDSVKKGTVLARLDNEQLLHQRDRANAILMLAESNLAQLETAIKYEKETVSGQIEQKQAEFNQAEANLRELLTGSRLQEIEKAKASLNMAKTEFEHAKGDWERTQALYESKNVSYSQYEQYKTRYEGASATLKQAEEHLALVVEGPRKENIEGGRAQLNRSKANLKLAEALRIELKRKEQELDTRQAEIMRAKAELSLVESQLKDTIAESPIDGVVLVKASEVGEIIGGGTAIMTIGDLAHPWLRGYIGEKELGRIKLGATVNVKTDSFPDKVYSGRISFISSESEFTPKQIQTYEERIKLVYRIKIDIDNPNHELKLNMPADADILLD
ncbi:MAG: efflux RND transporter periplasmic adaptor subunit [Nitrospinota bacterium]